MKFAGDFWAGLATTLVVLPTSIAFGLTIYASLGPEYASLGALAGIIGAVALGLIAPILGGTAKIITAPCAPATALLSAFAIQQVMQGTPAESVILLFTLIAILTGFLQILIGFTQIGNLIKYIPHTVVSGYLTSVGIIIILAQLPVIVGEDAGVNLSDSVFVMSQWHWEAILVGIITAGVMFYGHKITTHLPSSILGIVAGMISYYLLSIFFPALRDPNNDLLIGSLNVSLNGYASVLTQRWLDIGQITLGQLAGLLGTAMTLAVLLSIDTLKTSIVVDQLTHSRHQPNQELVAQGTANIASGLIGGVPGSGTMGPTLVNITSGAQTRYSSLIEGGMALIGLLLLISVLAWLPKVVLAAVLIVIGIKMFDFDAIKLVTSRRTISDFSIGLSVVVVALSFGLIWASATGVILSVILFLREQVGGTVVHRKSFLSQRTSSWQRTEEELKKIEQKGSAAAIIELQGSLFFGTARQLSIQLEEEILKREYVIIDFLRVVSMDLTAAHVFQLIKFQANTHHCKLIFTNLKREDDQLEELLIQLDILKTKAHDTTQLDTLDDALIWVENKILGHSKELDEHGMALELCEFPLFADFSEDTIQDLVKFMKQISLAKDSTIYNVGDHDQSLYFLRKGRVNIHAPISASRPMHHIAVMGRGAFFGGLSFIDQQLRGDAAIAETDVELFALSRQDFDYLSESHKRLGFSLMHALAQNLGHRLRRTDSELTLLLQ